MTRISVSCETHSETIVLHFTARDVVGTEKPLFGMIPFSAAELRGLDAPGLLSLIAERLQRAINEVNNHVDVRLAKKDK